MKKLYLVRHAKSSWKNYELSDFERPLNKRGYKAIDIMAKKLLKKNVLFDLIYSSPALRAAYTARSLAQRLSFPLEKIFYTESLYESGKESVIQLITKTSDDFNSLAIFSHNPTLNLLTNYYIHHFSENIPTLGIVEIEFKTNTWANLSAENAKLNMLDYPKKA